ncbi:hypothetical protein VW35_08330 [Devosia soli]|uniref:Uncharacterized protein n=1 Tax=Devosia soli TaxID=361041 RepID=A0A0F5LDN0_9HYPH|nr:hypothetical protein VW35_08330 [Devosia soli]
MIQISMRPLSIPSVLRCATFGDAQPSAMGDTVCGQRLLQVLDVIGSMFDKTLSLPQMGTKGCHLGIGAEASAYQAIAMQLQRG